MEFRGFRSISEYESECARFGYKTRRVSFHDQGGNSYFALVTAPPQKTTTSIEAWTLFTADESAEVLDGVISGGAFMHAQPEVINGKLEPGYLDENGVDKNWLGKLAKHGFFPDDPQDAHGCYSSAPSHSVGLIEQICFFDPTGQLCLPV